jgi:hypothetical protein
VRETIAEGIVTEDRKRARLFPNLPVVSKASAGALGRIAQPGWLSRRYEDETARPVLDAYASSLLVAHAGAGSERWQPAEGCSGTRIDGLDLVIRVERHLAQVGQRSGRDFGVSTGTHVLQRRRVDRRRDERLSARQRSGYSCSNRSTPSPCHRDLRHHAAADARRIDETHGPRRPPI